MIEQIVVPIFVSLKVETRNKLREIFKIPMSSHAEVVTDNMGVGRLMCDGTTNIDLQQLTVEKMRDFLGTAAVNETVYDLFKRVVEKIEKVDTTPETPTIGAKLEEPKTTQINLNKCPDCEYTHASKQGMRMHILRKHLHK